MKAEGHSRSMGLRPNSPFSSFRFHLSCFPHVPLSVPYWNRGTYGSILRCLAAGKIVHGSDLRKLELWLSETLGVASLLLCGSGSLALEIALRAFGIGHGDDVLIPAFCCSAVVSPIMAVGAVPVFADVGAELNVTAETAEAALTTKTRAMIIPHLFGNPAEIGAIVDLARSRRIHVIDDAAQALGARLNGRPVGGFGDAGVVSFGREKVCFGLGGGAVILANEELAERVGSVRLAVPGARPALSGLISTLFQHRWRRWSQPLARAASLGSQPAPDKPPSPYRKEWLANLNAAVAASLLETLQGNIAARRARAAAYRRLLGGDERVQLVAHRKGSACLAQVMRVLPRRRNDDLAGRVIGALSRSGYEVQGSYIPIHLLPGFEQCKWRRLSYTENVWEELIELPCEPGVSLPHVERIAAIVKQALDARDRTHR